MRIRTVNRSMLLKKSLNEVFDFFSNADNLNQLTPSNLQFQITTPLPIIMKEGQIIDYKIKLYGIPFNWKTLITQWNQNESFTDSQVKGPYIKWVHQHKFKSVEEGVIMYDKIEYVCPGGPLEPIIHALIVKKDIEKIFDYREEMCEKIFNSINPSISQ